MPTVRHLVPAVVLSVLCVTGAMASRKESELYTKLKDGYDILERPVANSSQPVVVNLGVVLQQIIDLDEKNQILMVNAWLKYTWHDYKLVWDPSDFDGVSDVRMPSQHVLWKPDVLLYNSVSSSFDSTYPTNLVVYSNGLVNWIPPGIFEVSCKIEIAWFPFDEQHCFFKFGSWTYDGTKLDLQPDVGGLDMSEYLMNGEWNLYNTTATRNEKFYDCCPEPYPALYFYMHMRRRTLYYGFNMIIPCILITLMTILGFMLPPDSGEKIGLQITVLLSICFFLSIVSEITPPTSEAVPLLGIFFSTCMFVVAASVVLTVAVLNLHHRTPDMHRMGPVSKALLLYWIPYVLGMSRPGRPIKRADLPALTLIAASMVSAKACERLERFERGVDFDSSSADKGTPFVSNNNLQSSGGDTPNGTGAAAAGAEGAVHARINECFRLLAMNQHCMDLGQQATLVMLHRIYSELKFVTHRMGDEDEASEEENEWKFAAMCIDRLCLWVFTGFICASTCYIFFSAPYLTA